MSNACCVGKQGPAGFPGKEGPRGPAGVNGGVSITGQDGVELVAMGSGVFVFPTSEIMMGATSKGIDFDVLDSGITMLQAVVSGRFERGADSTPPLTIRMRIGGTINGMDGTIVVSGSFTPPVGSTSKFTTGLGAPFARPSGVQIVKLTVEAPPGNIGFYAISDFHAAIVKSI